LIKLKIWRMEDEEQVEVFQGRIKEERFQFVQDGDNTYMIQLDMPKARKVREVSQQGKRGPSGTSTPPKTPCPHCGKSFVVGRGLNRHLKSCPKKPKATKPKKKTRKQAPTTKIQETQSVKETETREKESKEQAS
jgi:hypothetical protein